MTLQCTEVVAAKNLVVDPIKYYKNTAIHDPAQLVSNQLSKENSQVGQIPI